MEPRCTVTFDCAHIPLPSHALFVGSSLSGKTRLCLHFIRNPHIFSPPPSRILLYYDQFQDTYLEVKKELETLGIELKLFKGCEGLSIDTVPACEDGGQTLVIIDDFSELTSSSYDIAKLVCNGRHRGISVYLVWHSLFNKHPASRLICQNIHLYFFLPSLRLESQLRTFGAQLGIQKALLSAYHQVQADQEEEYRYVLLDAGPHTPPILRVRSHIHRPIQYTYS